MSKFSFTKIALQKFNPDLSYEDQTCGLNLEFSEEITNTDGKFEFAKENKAKLKNFFCHNDLLEKFNIMRSHLALVCEMNANLKKLDPEEPDVLAPRIFATGIVFTGDGESDGIVIVGFKVLANGSRLNLVTPNVQFGDYEHGGHLTDLLGELEQEAGHAYRGKRKVVQGDLFDSGEGEADGGTDDEQDEPADPRAAIKAFRKSIKESGMVVTMTAGNGKEVQL